MSRFERFSYGAEFDFDESREDDDIKSRNHNRHTNESKKSGYLHDDDYTSKLNKKYTDCNARGKSYDYDKGQARYSISSESEGYEGFDKKPKSFKDSGPLQVKTDFMKNFKSRIGSKEEEDSESEEELASARALTLKTKLILSKLGWNANTISGNENKLVKNGDEEKKEMKDNKFYDPFSDDSSTKKPYHHRQEKQTVEERRVWASELPSVKTRDLEGQRDRKVGSKASLKKFLDSEDDCEATDFRITGETANSGVKDVDLIEMNIRECRSLIDSNKTDCEEVRNVKVQPRLENNKIKKRHCSDYMEKIQSESEDVQVVEPKRFKKSSKYPEEEEADYWKDDRSVFRTVDRRIRVKDRSPFKMKRYRSRSTSSFSGDSYSSYERRRSKHSYKKKHKRQDSRDSFGWRDKLRGQEERRGYKYEEKEKDTRSFDKWSPKLKKKSHSSDFKERVEAKSQVDVQLMKEEKPKKMTTHCDYFDEGSHWCERCNVIYEESVDYLKHLHSDSHQKSVRKDPKPWEDKSEEGGRVKSSRNKISVPLKGLEFMIGTSAFYCKLCSELIADVKLAEKHIKSESHNGNYRDFLQKNPKYAKLRTMDVESRLFQAVHVSHQEEIPESDYDVLPLGFLVLFDLLFVSAKCFGERPVLVYVLRNKNVRYPTIGG